MKYEKGRGAKEQWQGEDPAKSACVVVSAGSRHSNIGVCRDVG